MRYTTITALPFEEFAKTIDSLLEGLDEFIRGKTHGIQH